MSANADTVKIGLVSISDRASTGVYEDKGIPALQDWLGRALNNPLQLETRLIASTRRSGRASLAIGSAAKLSRSSPSFCSSALSFLRSVRVGSSPPLSSRLYSRSSSLPSAMNCPRTKYPFFSLRAIGKYHSLRYEYTRFHPFRIPPTLARFCLQSGVF